MKKHPPAISITRARELRREPAQAKKAMRCLLEAFLEARFRLQVPLRHFIAGFASHRLQIVIEIDGGQHCAEADKARSADLEAEGYRIIRFWNREVLANRDGCAIRLTQFQRDPHPHPAATRQQAAKSPHPSPTEGEEA